MNAYNGWTNYETWVVKLWMGNDESSYRYWQDEITRIVANDDDAAKHQLAQAIKAYHEDAMPEISGVYSDLLDSAISKVEWYEIASAMVDDYIRS